MADDIPKYDDTVPVSYEDTMPVEPKKQVEPEEVSTAEGLLSGAQSGATFGFADELGAAASALGGKLSGDVRPWEDVYNMYLEQERADKKRIQEGAPAASMIGNIAGSAIPTAFVAPLQAAKNASLLAKAAKGGVEGLVSGTLVGGVQGAGEAEGGLSNRAQAAIEGIKTGGLVGLGAGAGAPIVGSTLKALGTIGRKALKATDFTDDLAAAVEAGAEGKLLFGEGAKRRVEKGVVSAQQAAEEQVEAALRDAGEAQAAALKAAKETGAEVDLQDIYKKAQERARLESGPSLPEQEAAARLQQELTNLLERSKSGDLLEAQAQKKSLQRLSKMGRAADAYPQSPETSRILEQTSRQVRQAVEAPFEQAGDINLIREINKRYGAAEEAKKLLPSINETSRLQKDFQPALREKVEQFGSLLKEATDPNVAQSMQAKGVMQAPDQLIKAAEEFERVRRLSRGGITGMEQIWGAISTLPAKSLNIASLGVSTVKTTASDAAKSLANLPKNQALKVADWYASKGLNTPATLIRQVAGKDGQARNAALFMLTQNPDFKKAIFGEEPSDTEE